MPYPKSKQVGREELGIRAGWLPRYIRVKLRGSLESHNFNEQKCLDGNCCGV